MDSQTPHRNARRISRRLTRDQRLQVFTLHRAGKKLVEIPNELGITIHQVRNTIRSGSIDPAKAPGRKPKLSPEQEDELETFVCSSSETRQMTYLELAMSFPHWNVGEIAIRSALKRRGYTRHIAKNKPAPLLKKGMPMTEKMTKD